MGRQRVSIAVRADEVEFRAVRAQGAGGQNVDKVSSAVHLRFDVRASSLPDEVRARLLALRDRRISHEGVIVLKAQKFRTQDKNRVEALRRLQRLVDSVASAPVERVPTQPSAGSRRRRLDEKSRRGRLKALRGRVGAAAAEPLA